MKLTLISAWLLLATALAMAQTNQVRVEKRSDGWWAVWTNTPPRFIVSTSSNMINWTLFITKSSGESFKSFELAIAQSNDVRFLKFAPYPYPPVSTSLTTLLHSLTNRPKSNQRKTK